MKTTINLLLFICICLLSALSHAEEESQNTAPPESSWINDTVEPQTKRVERFVMPMTNWLEEKLQDSSVMNPARGNKSAPPKEASEKSLTLRDAIKKALSTHKGTVLSADRIEKNGNLSYRIKILSRNGVIRMVDISSDQDKHTIKASP